VNHRAESHNLTSGLKTATSAEDVHPFTDFLTEPLMLVNMRLAIERKLGNKTAKDVEILHREDAPKKLHLLVLARPETSPEEAMPKSQYLHPPPRPPPGCVLCPFG